MTETATRRPLAANVPVADLPDLEPPVVTAVRFMNLFEIIAHLADRISHLETRVDEAGIPYRSDLLPDPESFSHSYSADRGVCPSVTGRTR